MSAAEKTYEVELGNTFPISHRSEPPYVDCANCGQSMTPGQMVQVCHIGFWSTDGSSGSEDGYGGREVDGEVGMWHVDCPAPRPVLHLV